MNTPDRDRFKKSHFKIKPIETRFDGYHFRSRLEARWAVFFKTLSIQYIYEMEGFVLEGEPYLPDFFLPQHDCFIEIKGVEPTSEELRKARLLSLYTMKRVYLFSGEVGRDKNGLSAYSFNPPAFGVWGPSGPQDKETEPGPEVYWTVQRLSDAGLNVKLNEQKDDIVLVPGLTWKVSHGVDPELDLTWDDQCLFLEERGRGLIAAMDLLRKHRLSVLEALKPDRVGDDWIWVDIQEWFNCAWGECSNCSAMGIYMPDERLNPPCGCHAEVNYDAPRILNAYKSAREMRF